MSGIPVVWRLKAAAMRYDEELFAQIGHNARLNFPCAFIGEK